MDSREAEDSLQESNETLEKFSDNSQDSMEEKGLSGLDNGHFSPVPEEPKLLSIIPSVEFELKNPSREDFIASELIGYVGKWLYLGSEMICVVIGKGHIAKFYVQLINQLRKSMQ